MRGLYVGQLAFTWTENSTAEATRVSIEHKIDGFVKGDLEYAAEVFTELWEILNKDGDIKAPGDPPPPVSPPWSFPGEAEVLISHDQIVQATSPARWSAVKTSLIKSIREGVLFDRKYCARYYKTGDTLKPVYFSSIIMGDKVQQLNKCASKSVYGLPEVLSAFSGEVPRGRKNSHG